MHKSLDYYLHLLRDYDPLTEEQHAAIGARIRREVIARYGRFDVPLQAASPKLQAPSFERGTLSLPLALRSFSVGRAFAFAAIAVVAVGVTVAVQRSGWGLRRSPVAESPRVAPPSEIVASAAPIVPGSGGAVSVFTIVENQELRMKNQGPTTGAQPPAVRRVRRGRPLNPAAGVFSQWADGVFSEEEMLQSGREGKNVFSS